MADLFRTLVDGVAERDDLVAEAGARAEELPPPKVAGRTADEIAADVVRLALLASLAGIKAQMRAAIKHVIAEAQAVIGADPRKVRAVTDIDVAERKAELIAAHPAPAKEGA